MHWQLGMGRARTASLRQIKDKLTTPPVLVYFDPLAPTKIETDASKNMSALVYCHSNARTENGDQWRTDPRECRTPNATRTYTIRNYWL